MASNVTTVVGEDKAPITTLAIGEEHVITTLVGEQAQPHPDYTAAAGSSSNEGPEAQGSATTVVGESWNPAHISTLLGGEETVFTTLAIGEEGGGGGYPATTLLGEGGGGQQTTTLLGEGGGGRPPITTTVVGEEGPSTTTIAGEGGPFGNY
jgi:hypothetical protein